MAHAGGDIREGGGSTPNNIQILLFHYDKTHGFTHAIFRLCYAGSTTQDRFVHATYDEETTEKNFARTTLPYPGDYLILEITGTDPLAIKAALWRILQHFPRLILHTDRVLMPYRAHEPELDTLIEAFWSDLKTSKAINGIKIGKSAILKTKMHENFFTQGGLGNAIFFAAHMHRDKGYRCAAFVTSCLQAAYLHKNNFFTDYPELITKNLAEIEDFLAGFSLAEKVEIARKYLPEVLWLNAHYLNPNILMNSLMVYPEADTHLARTHMVTIHQVDSHTFSFIPKDPSTAVVSPTAATTMAASELDTTGHAGAGAPHPTIMAASAPAAAATSESAGPLPPALLPGRPHAREAWVITGAEASATTAYANPLHRHRSHARMAGVLFALTADAATANTNTPPVLEAATTHVTAASTANSSSHSEEPTGIYSCCSVM